MPKQALLLAFITLLWSGSAFASSGRVRLQTTSCNFVCASCECAPFGYVAKYCSNCVESFEALACNQSFVSCDGPAGCGGGAGNA